MACWGFIAALTMASWVWPPPSTDPTTPPSSAAFSASTGDVSSRRAIMVAIISTCPISSVAVSMSMSRYLAGPRQFHPLEEVGHHDADLAPLAAEELLHLLGEDGVRVVRLGVVLEPLGVEEHLCSFPGAPSGGSAPLACSYSHRCSLHDTF